MRALMLTEEGGPVIGEASDPSPGPGEVLVEIDHAGLNHVDLLLAEGRLGLKPALPHTLGIEGAGTISTVGLGVEEARVGETVTIYPYQGCGHCLFCYAGEEQVCPVGQTTCIGLTLPGTLTEKVVVAQRSAVRLPDGVPPEAAAACTITGMTAYRLLITRGAVQPGQTVLIRAVGSGVGVMAAQLAQAAGARVIATAGSDDKLEQATRLGIADVINHTSDDVPARVKELTDGRGVDLILDYVGAATWADNLRCLGRAGRIALCGAHTGTKVELELWHLFAKEHTVIGSYGGTKQELTHTLDLMRDGTLTPVVHSTTHLDGAQEALRNLDDRQVFGKIVVKP